LEEQKKEGHLQDNTSSDSIDIPTSVLQNRNISVLEAIAHYLKHTLHLSYHEIAVLLNRNDRTIWTCCDRASKKLQSNNIFKKKALHQIMIPSSSLRDRSFAVLESITLYLKDELHFSYHEIAELLNRDDRTVWTAYQRALKKRGDLR